METPVWGNPATIRMDPAGAFRSEQVDQYTSKHKIMSDHIPAEAHWELPLVERAIQSPKR